MRPPIRPLLLANCAVAAVLAAMPHTAQAQAFAGTPDVVTGFANVFEVPDGGPGVPATTNVQLFNQETVINWTAVDTGGTGSIDFLPEGTRANFTYDGSGNFTVLNRVLPVDISSAPTAATISLNGIVESSNTNGTAGNIWFYSPTGIFVGPTAQITVGSLVLTTNDIQFVENEFSDLGTIYGAGGLVEFRGNAGSTGMVEIAAGAQINAVGFDSYVALVAPRIVQNGSISANRNVAYIAAEQVDMFIDTGLFDFTVTVGTTDTNGVVHTGTTTGAASADSSDAKRIAMVAVPKNDALTMLLSGTIGYAPATDVTNEGGTLVLAAGFTSTNPADLPANELGSISIGETTFNNHVNAYATDRIDILAQGGTTDFVNSTNLFAGSAITLTADAGGTISGQGLIANSARPGMGGAITFTASEGGSIAFGQGLFLSANNQSIPFSSPTSFFDGTGGQISLLADGGTISALFLNAAADGTADQLLGTGGTGRGGTIEATVTGGGVMSFPNLSLDANGVGGSTFDDNSVAGNGFGGSISLVDSGGVFELGDVVLGATGRGGLAAQSGNGTGGNIAIDLTSGTHEWTELSAEASGFGGGVSLSDAIAGSGSALSDAVRLTVSGTGELAVSGDIVLRADARSDANGAAGYTNQAGGVLVEALTGGSIYGYTLQLTAEAQAPRFSAVGTTSPIQRGGTVNVLVDGGSITTSYLGLSASAFGSPADSVAGSAFAGTAEVSVIDGGSLFIDGGDGGFVDLMGSSSSTVSGIAIFADAFGAPGAFAADAVGGTANLIIQDATVEVLGEVTVSASARSLASFGGMEGSTPRVGPTLTGGEASVELRAGATSSASLIANAMAIQSSGDARTNLISGLEEGTLFGHLEAILAPANVPIRGDNGNGTGGTAQLTVAAGTLDLSTLVLDANGLGGESAAANGDTPYQAGNGTGGTTQLSLTGGAITLDSLQLTSSGVGGGSGMDIAGSGGDTAAFAGSGSGGSASLLLGGGSLNTQDATVAANGIGGTGMSHITGGEASSGGSGTGGTARVQSQAGSTASFVANTLSLQASGVGGDGGASDAGVSGNGGQGTGSIATLALGDGSFTLGAVSIDATGTGGNSGDASSGAPGSVGGEGSGGQASFTLADTTGPVGARGIGSVMIDASGTGGTGSTAEAESDAGTARVSVAALSPASAIDITGDLTAVSSGTRAGPVAGIEATVSGAPLTVGGDMVFETSGGITVTAAQPLRADGTLVMIGRSFASTGLLESGGAMEIAGNDGIEADRLASGGSTVLQSFDGSISVTQLASASGVSVRGNGVSLTSTGDLLIEEAAASTGALTFSTDGSLTTQFLSAPGAITLTAGGDLTALDGLSGASISLTAGGDIASGGDLTADGALTIDAGGALQMFGAGRGTTITVTSSDFLLGPGSTLGERDVTENLTILARVLGPTGSANRIFIGGETVSGDYSLDSNEMNSLFADNAITFRAVGNGAAVTDITIGNFSLSYGTSGNIGSGGTLEISGPTQISIAGDVTLTTSSAADTFLIDPTRVELNTETGSIAMLDPTGAALGQLHIVGDTIAIATGSVLGQLQSLTDFAAIKTALDQPGGNPQAITASSITFDVVDGLYIQNNGASTEVADRGGFIADTIVINTASNATRIAVNGQLIDQGQTLSGIDVLPLVSINGNSGVSGGLFNPASTINGCLIVGACAAPGLLLPDLPRDTDLLTPLKADDDSDPVIDEDAIFGAPLIELAPVEPLISPPLVDEPITGVGNDDLWESACDPASETCSERSGDR